MAYESEHPENLPEPIRQMYQKTASDLYDLVMRMVPLRPEEEVFRELYMTCRDFHPEQPHEIGELKSYFKRAGSKLYPDIADWLQKCNTDENAVFDDGMNAAIHLRMRYLPAYWHTHVSLEVVCVFWGSCTNFVAGQKLEMKEGDICILAPKIRHAVSVFSDQCIVLNMELRLSTFEQAFFGTLDDTDILADFFRHALYNSPTHPYLLFHTSGDYELYNLLLYAFQECSEDLLYKKRMVNNIIMAFFTILLRKYWDRVVIPDLNVRDGNQTALHLLHYMQQHYDTVTLSGLSTTFGYSKRQTQRLIAELTGKSFSQNIQNIRLQKAADLLTVTTLPIANIILDLGWSDAGNFRTLFRRKYGMTPAQYRRKNRDITGGTDGKTAPGAADPLSPGGTGTAP